MATDRKPGRRTVVWTATIAKLGLLWSALLVSTLPAPAQQSWENLGQLRVGEKIQVVDQKLKSLTGTFRYLSEEAITLQVGGNVVAVERAGVYRVTSQQRSKRGRNALMGAAIGAAAGLGAGVAYCHGDCDLARDIAWGVPVMLGSGVAAGIGVAFRSRPTIYRATLRRN